MTIVDATVDTFFLALKYPHILLRMSETLAMCTWRLYQRAIHTAGYGIVPGMINSSVSFSGRLAPRISSPSG